MKTLRLLFASLTFCLAFMGQTNAQTITNNSLCLYQVKANVLPAGACALTGAGPVFGVAGSGTSITFPLPGPPGSHWVPSYGVRKPGFPARVPGTVLCGFATVEYVGQCFGVPTFATYSGGNVVIN